MVREKYLELLFYIAISSFALLDSGLSTAATRPPVEIQVYGEHSGKNIIYYYKVINNNEYGFLRFNIGYRYNKETNEHIAQFGKLPVGATYGMEGEVGEEILLGSNSTTQPPGWVASVYGPGLVTLEWRIPNENKLKTPAIEPGESLDGFSVTIPASDAYANLLIVPLPAESMDAYFTGNFIIGFPPPTPEYQGKLQVIDKTPPTLAVSVKPDTLWPPKGQLETVNVAITARDDYDPQPAIRLESITANETLAPDDIVEATIGQDDRAFKLRAKREGSGNGRTYTITYSATDAVGNSTRSTATVVVPHDQRGRN